jgi:hypothetical protein
MPDDELFHSLEERLRDDARGLLGETPPPPLIADLRDTFVRRRRRRRVVQSLGAAAVVLLGLAGLRWLSPQRGEGTAINGPTARVETPTKHAPQAARPHSEVALRATGDARALRPGALAIGVWVARPRPDGKTELVPGLYVPEQAEPIDSQDWSQAERLAASRLLGPEANVSHHKTI